MACPTLSWPYKALRLKFVEPVHTEIGFPALLSTMNLLCISLAFLRGTHSARIPALSICASFAAPVSSSFAW